MTWTVPPDDIDIGPASALVANPVDAERLGSRLLDAVPVGSCVPADRLDLGALATQGDWVSVCRWSGTQSPAGGVIIRSAQDLPNLAYSEETPPSPDICFRRIVGNWWSFYSGNGLAEPCSPSFTFQGL